jgi:tRNA(Ile)-lysidine synthase
MPRSHPPALLKIVERTLREECGALRGERVLIAVSGGGDSQALLHALARLAPKLGLELAAHGVDHGLRKEASAELDVAEELARRCGVAFSRSRVRVDPGGNLQARARAARYAALSRAAQAASCTLIATAHHADDRAETVLLRMLRGAGPRGLAVLPARTAEFLRPFIRARRADIQAHALRHALPTCQDPSNVDPRFLRVRVRRELLPLLESLSPRIIEHLNALADALGERAAPLIVEPSGELPAPLGRTHLVALRRAVRLAQRGARVSLPGGRVARVEGRAGQPVVVLEPGKRGRYARKKPG